MRGAIEGTRVAQARIGAQTVPIDERGRFAFHLNLERSGYLELQVGQRVPLFLSPGDQVSLSAKAPNVLGTIEFAGANAHIQRYLTESLRLGQTEVDFRLLFGLPEDRFLEETAALEARFTKRFDEFLAAHRTVHRDFARLEPEAIRYTWADVRLHYPGLAKRFTSTPPDPPRDDFDRYLATLDFNDASLLALEPYVGFLESYLDQKARLVLAESAELRSLDHQVTRACFEVATSTFTDAHVRSRMLHDLMERQIVDFGVRGADDLLATFDAQCADSVLRGAIDSLAAVERSHFGGVEIEVYKKTGPFELEAYLFRPQGLARGARAPAIVYFHGAGWVVGRPEWAFPACRYFAARGMVAISAQYRLVDRHGATPIEAIADARSVFRWLRRNADRLGIDPGRIAAAGWSAGGHLAASAALIDRFDEHGEDQAVNASPDALVLWYPAVDVARDTWFQSQVAPRASAAACSPAQHVRGGAPPTLILQGSDDRVVKLAQIEAFATAMRAAGNTCELVTYPGRGHLFNGNDEDDVDTKRRADAFLASLGYLEGEPDVQAMRATRTSFPTDAERWGLR